MQVQFKSLQLRFKIAIILFLIYVLLNAALKFLDKGQKARVKAKPFFHCQVTLILRGKPCRYTEPIRPNFNR